MYLIALVIETKSDGIAQMVQDRGFATRSFNGPSAWRPCVRQGEARWTGVGDNRTTLLLGNKKRNVCGQRVLEHRCVKSTEE